MVSMNDGKVRQDGTEMTADRGIRRENDGKMSWFGPKPQRLISVRSDRVPELARGATQHSAIEKSGVLEVQIFPGPLT